jgi:hypothetical protein
VRAGGYVALQAGVSCRWAMQAKSAKGSLLGYFADCAAWSVARCGLDYALGLTCKNGIGAVRWTVANRLVIGRSSSNPSSGSCLPTLPAIRQQPSLTSPRPASCRIMATCVLSRADRGNVWMHAEVRVDGSSMARELHALALREQAEAVERATGQDGE